MWNGHHHSENGEDPPSNDPARFAAVSALASFSQGAAYPPAQPVASAMSYSSHASHAASFRGQQEGHFAPVDSYQEQALRQQALYTYQNQNQHSAHPMHQQQQQQHQQQHYSAEALDYSRQMAGRHEAEQLQRMEGQQQQHHQQWGNEQASDEDDNEPAVATADTLDEGTDDDEPEEAVAMEHEDENGNDDDAMDADEDSDTGSVQVPNIVPRGKPEAMAVKLAAAAMEENKDDLEAEMDHQEDEAEVVAEVEGEEALIDESENVVVAKMEKPKPARSRSKPKSSRKKPPLETSERSELLLNEDTPGITDEEYENLEALMIQFCRVPLLAEFSRPVTLLHPEVS
jgi:hypothetical protein